MIEEVCLSFVYLVEESYGPEALTTLTLFRKLQKGRTVGSQKRERPIQNRNLGWTSSSQTSQWKRKCVWGEWTVHLGTEEGLTSQPEVSGKAKRKHRASTMWAKIDTFRIFCRWNHAHPQWQTSKTVRVRRGGQLRRWRQRIGNGDGCLARELEECYICHHTMGSYNWVDASFFNRRLLPPDSVERLDFM